jgi:hypothetical protein
VNNGQDGFSAGLVKSPVCCFESCDLDTVSYRDGKRRQLRLWRMSTDINVNVRMVPEVKEGIGSSDPIAESRWERSTDRCKTV